jgi:hypothetical protein
MATDNYVQDRGCGNWLVGIYNPEKEIGPFEGTLTIAKDFHIITATGGKCVASIPNQNISYCLNVKPKTNVV